MTPADYPSLYRASDQASIGGQSLYLGLTRLELVLLVVVAALTTSYALIPTFVSVPSDATNWQTLVAALIATGMTGAFISRLTNRIRRDDKRWFDGRAVAESIKTQTWRYMMCIEPFTEGPKGDQDFIAALQQTLKGRPELVPDTTSGPTSAITPAMRSAHNGTLEERRDTYIRERLTDQADWYAKKSRQNRERGRNWFLIGIAAQVVALGFAITRVGISSPYVSVAGLFTAVAAVATAWANIGRHDELARSYGLAAEELRTMIGLAEVVTTQQELRHVVELGELSISREHTMWVAKRADTLAPSLLKALGRSES